MQYKITGDSMPVVECRLSKGEAMRTEKGSMVWMSPNIKMETSGGGGLGKALGRMVSGESIFQNIYTSQVDDSLIAFGSSFVGNIRELDIQPGKSIICQKSAFLASEMGVDLSIFFRKKLGAGFFGGEGFIMQKLSGQGKAFVEIDGSAVEYELGSGESMLVNTGYLVLMDETCTMEIERIKGAKNMILGGEGLFNTRVTGPGRIVLQTMSIATIAGELAGHMPSSGS